MKNYLQFFALAVLFILTSSTTSFAQNKYKCMLQMNAYDGEKAYVIISLINPKGQYEQTLAVLGDDKQWYKNMKEWFKFQTKSKEKLNAITGASIGGGDRAAKTLSIDDSKLDKGYKIRFESAVEEQKYVVNDIEIPFTTQGLAEKATGKGYIKLAKVSKVQ